MHSNPRIVVRSPKCKPVPCIVETNEESENDTWSTISSSNSSGHFRSSEKDSHIQRHALTESHEVCSEHGLNEYSRDFNTSQLNETQARYTYSSETSLIWSFLHVSSIYRYMHYIITQVLLTLNVVSSSKT